MAFKLRVLFFPGEDYIYSPTFLIPFAKEEGLNQHSFPVILIPFLALPIIGEVTDNHGE